MPTNRSWWQWLTGWPGAGLALVAALAVAFLVHPGRTGAPGARAPAPGSARSGAGQALAAAPATQPATTAPAPTAAVVAVAPVAPAPADSPPANRLPTQITFKTLGNFNYDPPASSIPQTVRALDGQRVRLTGFMIPLDIENGKAKQFVMLAAIPGCLYCQPPQLNEMVVVNLTGAGIEPTDQPRAVTGTLAVGEERQDGAVVSLFRLKGDDVADAEVK